MVLQSGSSTADAHGLMIPAPADVARPVRFESIKVTSAPRTLAA